MSSKPIVLLTSGSLGDIQPFVALAKGLQDAGENVRLAAPEDARLLSQENGIDFYPIDKGAAERLSEESHKIGLETGNSLRFKIHRIRSRMKIALQVNQRAWEACQGSKSIVYRLGGYLAGDSIAEKLNIRCYQAGLVPYSQTREFPSLHFSPFLNLGRSGNWLSYTIADQFIWLLLRPMINSFRKNDLALDPLPINFSKRSRGLSKLPVIYGFSPVIIPRPCEWPDYIHITGHWPLAPTGDWQIPQGLENFIQQSPSPIYIGFGSMTDKLGRHEKDLALQALGLCDQRAVLSGFDDEQTRRNATEEHVFFVHHIPHDWLLPQMTAAVHHGGVGTTMACLKAGLPSVIIPFNYDQPFWGSRIVQLQAGPCPVPRRKLNAQNMAEAITACLQNEKYKSKAAELGNKIRSEDGVRKAVAIIRSEL